MFNCDKCGKCCRSLDMDKSGVYTELDRGDGVCKYFDTENNLCGIYDRRPVICSVDKAYMLYFKDIMAIDEYYRKNYNACALLKIIK